MERFQLFNADTLVLSFSHDRTLTGDVYQDIVVHEPTQLPIRLKNECTESTVRDWIGRRSVPVNRHHMEAMLGVLNLKEPFDIMRYSHALSLNDTFWMKEEGEALTFAAINLYDNQFDEALGWIAFTGLPSDISRNLSTPELTTVGVLPKFWQRMNFGDIRLVKGGTSGYSNAGYEPYREVASHIIANRLGIATIPYHLEYVSGKIASVSKLFTSKETGLMTGSEYLDYKYPNIKAKALSDLFAAMRQDGIDLAPFYKMCFFDYIIENFDRHLNNWGFRVDNQTQRILGFAPIWDNGMSLDYDKPQDLREKFDFASFSLKYDFVKDCEYTKEFQGMTNKLLVSIKSGALFEQIYDATKEYYTDRQLTEKTLAFVEERCMEFMRPLSLEKEQKPSFLERLEQHKKLASEQSQQGSDQKPKKPPER